MNLAIVIAVSEYKDPRYNLAACVNDASLISGVISKSGKYKDVLLLNTRTASGNVKAELAQFVSKHKEQSVDELFFYYSGHGDVHADDFCYLLTDYEEKRRNQTSLANSELDSMIRSLKPKLTVKVVDACHSGVSYVKATDSLSKSLQASKGSFEKCYFMFSSQKEQKSWQDSHLSDFTESFANAILHHDQDKIRYKDIADYIADDFDGNADQTPAFVVQADLTEVFCEIGAALKEHISGFVRHPPVPTSEMKEVPKLQSLLDRVRLDASRYCTEAEVVEAFDHMKAAVAEFHYEKTDELYKYKTELHAEPIELPSHRAIARWLKDHKDEYFIELDYIDEEYEDTVKVPKPRSRMMAYTFLEPDFEYKSVTRSRPKVEGFHHTANPPVFAIKVQAIPQFQNLSWWNCYLTWVFSKSALRTFYAFVKLRERNWEDRELAGDVQWKMREVGIRDKVAVADSARRALREFEDVVLAPIVEKFETKGDGGADKGDQTDSGKDRPPNASTDEGSAEG